MGLRGPAPKPSIVRIREGMRGHRPLPENEPQPAAVPPRCPSHLSAPAKKEWKRLASLLMRMRVLTEADGDALEQLVTAIVTKRMAEQAIEAYNRQQVAALTKDVETKNEAAGTEIKVQDIIAPELMAVIGWTVAGSTGNQVLHPLFKVITEAEARVRWWSTQFGLTPSARTRVAAEPLAPEGSIVMDDLEAALSRPRKQSA